MPYIVVVIIQCILIPFFYTFWFRVVKPTQDILAFHAKTKGIVIQSLKWMRLIYDILGWVQKIRAQDTDFCGKCLQNVYSLLKKSKRRAGQRKKMCFQLGSAWSHRKTVSWTWYHHKANGRRLANICYLLIISCFSFPHPKSKGYYLLDKEATIWTITVHIASWEYVCNKILYW